MLFNSISFFIFFAMILSIYYLPFFWRGKKAVLLVASYAFYAAWNPPFVLLLWISTIIDWKVAARIAALGDSEQKKRKLLLLLSLAVNLGFLGYFKYGTFLLDNFLQLTRLVGWNFQPEPLSIILPVGISFYTFQSMSYSIDVYYRRIKPSDNFLDFALYVSFFPQLVAGPIVRSEEFLPQCQQEKRPGGDEFGWGAFLLTYGLFQKVILADRILAPIVESVFSSQVVHNLPNDWTGIMAFSMQIYFDFNGYTNCAIGVALMLGFYLPRNFHFPYAAIGFSNFWQRWHISLSSWLRDYLYIPLGGNRNGMVRTNINLLITMLLGGLWHGASWNFIIWGGLHGFYLIVERFFTARKIHFPLPARIKAGLVFIIISLTWVFFRSHDFHTSMEILQGLFSLDRVGKNLKPFQYLGVSLMAFLLFLRHWKYRDSELKNIFVQKRKVSLITGWLLMAIILLYVRLGGGNAFIYFQF